MRVDGAGNGDTSSIETEEEARFEILSSSTQETTLSPAGGGKVVAASVRVPRSYFVRAYKLAKADAKDPDEATLKASIDLQLPGIRSAVKSCTGLRDDELISVESYPDVVPLLAAAVGATGAPAASATAPLTETVRGYSKEIAVGLLAVVSLFLVSSMVRKGTPAPVAVVAAPAGPPPVLEAGEVVAGEVGEGSPLLDGMELDQDAVRTQQMLDQVSTMVKENPDGAANLVKRWLNRS